MRSVQQGVIAIFYWIASVSPCAAFVAQPNRQISPFLLQRQSPAADSFSAKILKAEKNDDDKVEVGSKEYLEGFISSPIQDESVAERGSGLEQALNLGGVFTVGLSVLFLGFMASNGLL